MSIVYPSNTTWITARTNEGKITDDNCSVMLPKKINKLDKVILNLPYVTVLLPGSLPDASLSQLYLDEEHTKSLVELDITPYVVEKAKYITLRWKGANLGISLGPQYLENTWYYERNGKEIFLPNGLVKGNLPMPQYPVINYLVSSAIYNVVYNNGKKDGKLYVYYGEGDENNTTLTGEDDFGVRVRGVSVQDVQFRIYYTPLGETTKIDIPKTNPQPVSFAIPYNQQQNIISNLGLGKMAQLTANMMGVAKREVVRILRTPMQRRPQYSTCRKGKDEWVLINHDLQITNARTIDKETWAKNWAAQSSFVGVNRQTRTWNTPADIVERNAKVNEYIYITSDLDFSLVARRGKQLITAQALDLLVHALTYQASDIPTECNLMWITTIQPNTGNTPVAQGVVVNCSSFGFGNTLVFSGKTEDNLSGGKKREVMGSDTFCPDVYYCNEDGTAEEMEFACASEIFSTTYNSDEFPFGYAGGRGTINTYQWSGDEPEGVVLFDTGAVKMQKDPAEQINFTYLLSFLTDEPDLIIGPAFANSNALVKNLTSAGRSVKCWLLTSPLPRSSQVCSEAFGQPTTVTAENAQSMPYRISQRNGEWQIEFTDYGVCITDMNNNIILAHNGSQPKTYKFVVCTDYEILWRSIHAADGNSHN